MYDRDLQEQIEEVNKKFIENANERKKAEESEDVTSMLEAPAANVNFSNLSSAALAQFISRANLDEAIASEDFKNRLTRLNVLDAESEPTNNGIILFGNEPRETIVDAGVLGTIRFEDGSEETEDFDGPQVLAPQKIMDWIKAKVPNPNDRNDAKRKERDEAFFRLVREGVVNAIVHRDYTVSGSKTQVVVTKDSVTIMSPGSPLVTLEQLRSLNAPMRSRNPTLHYVFNRMGLAEERGLGLTSMKQAAETNELPLPSFAFEDPYLVLTIYRLSEAVVSSLIVEVLEQLSKSQRRGWEWLSKQGTASRGDYADALDIADRTATAHLGQFKTLGLVKVVEGSGRGRSTTYRVVAR
ncbi:hypothetical protein CA13_18720 [Planctomycetes bacterium CA13]|uniref:Uncharacterized protein n=1 Tax=Novipirellula herctigrandis TaxID=2527986 RepID=A0A5C5YZF4_9BACT|nr:hypothetical protein CA13_18720 [Planctomycetes bacterium CA13]